MRGKPPPVGAVMQPQPLPLPGAKSRVDPAVLRVWAGELALRHFGERFPGTVRWAPRLYYRAGDYTPSTQAIRLSLPYFRSYGEHETKRILLHELCHWWLFRQGIRHREDAPAFQGLLRSHGAPAAALPLSLPVRPLHVYVCPSCGARYRYRYQRRVDYACGPCCRRWAAGRVDARFRLVLVAGG